MKNKKLTEKPELAKLLFGNLRALAAWDSIRRNKRSMAALKAWKTRKKAV